MSKKSDTPKGTEVAIIDAQTNDFQLPDFLRNEARSDRTNLDASDVTIPRVQVAQDQTPLVKSGDVPRGSLFLNVTGEVLAELGTPLLFIPIVSSKEYMLWRDPQDGGGGLMARARPVNEGGKIRYKWDKPNQKFTTKIKNVVPVTWETGDYIDEDGLSLWGSQISSDKDSPPAASVHYNYLVMLPNHGNTMAAFSLAKSQVKRAKDLNAMLSMSNVNIYARQIKASVETAKNSNGQEFYNLRFRPAGYLQDEGLYEFAKQQHEHFVASGFVVDGSAGSDDDGDDDDQPSRGRRSGQGRAF